MQTELFTEEKQAKARERIQELRRTPHIFWNDPGHGWLEVNISDLKILGIESEISGYSYRNGEKAYLEEDMDAGTYIKALWKEYLNKDGQICSHEFQAWRLKLIDSYRENIFIRRLRHFK